MLQKPRVPKISNGKYTVFFYITNEDTKFGARTQKFDLINGGNYYNTTGFDEASYEIQGEVTDIVLFEQLTEILNSQEDIFYTPPYGSKTEIPCRAIDGVSSKTYNHSFVGLFSFDFKLQVSELKSSIQKQTTQSGFFASKFAFFSKIKDSFNKTYRTTITNINTAKGTINELNTNIVNATQTIPYLLDSVSGLIQSLNGFTSTIDSIVNLPEEISIRVESIMDQFSQLSDNINDRLTVQKSFIENLDITEYNNENSFTSNQTSVQNITQSIYYCFSINSFLNDVVNKEYLLVDDLQKDIDFLKLQIVFVSKKIRDRQQKLELITFIRNAIIVLQEKLSNLSILAQYTYQNIGSYKCYYDYYGVLDANIKDWAAFNKITDASNVNQIIKYY